MVYEKKSEKSRGKVRRVKCNLIQGSRKINQSQRLFIPENGVHACADRRARSSTRKEAIKILAREANSEKICRTEKMAFRNVHVCARACVRIFLSIFLRV